ncbi:MAG: glycosyltransferase [Bacteroidota bacterium]|nr:glycosyltransferase [Bacteroidota bacterium]
MRTIIAVIVIGFGVLLTDIFLMSYFKTANAKDMKRLLKPEGYDIFDTRYNEDFIVAKRSLFDKAGPDYVCRTCVHENVPESDTKVIRPHKLKKELLIMFDDGPDDKYTPRILDILKKENVPAAFFVIGMEAEERIPLVRRIFDEGFEIGNHTYTHPRLPQVSVSRTLLELRATQRLLQCITGHSTHLFRPPYGEQSQLKKIPIEDSEGPFYYNIFNSIDPKDWEEGINADSIFNRVVRMERKGDAILLHDGGGNREATVQALPRIIKHFKERGYTFVTAAHHLGKKPGEIMPSLDGDMDALLTAINRFVVFGAFHIEYFFLTVFIIAMVLAIGRYFIITVIAILQHQKTKKESFPDSTGKLVSIIIPAYNEEINATKTVDNILHSDYPNFEVIFVDDGSKDRTYDVVYEAFKDNPKVQVHTKANGGKASALNFGVGLAKGEYLVCIDSDTQLRHDAVTQLVKYFTLPDVGAVAGNVKVGNEKNVLTKWQSIEYITSQNFDKRACDLLTCITVIPGAIGAFRKSAVQLVGEFSTDTLAEDCEITMRMLRAGYRVRYSHKAIAVTEAPETMKMFITQRMRWSFGIMQSFWKHREMAFNPKFKTVGMVAYPNMLVFQVILPFLAPIADIWMIFSIIMGNGASILLFFLLYLGVEAFGSMVAFSFDRENIRKLVWLIPQRLIYRQLMFWVLFKSVLKAIKGEIMHWGFLKRTGSVKAIKTEV